MWYSSQETSCRFGMSSPEWRLMSEVNVQHWFFTFFNSGEKNNNRQEKPSKLLILSSANLGLHFAQVIRCVESQVLSVSSSLSVFLFSGSRMDHRLLTHHCSITVSHVLTQGIGCYHLTGMSNL